METRGHIAMSQYTGEQVSNKYLIADNSTIGNQRQIGATQPYILNVIWQNNIVQLCILTVMLIWLSEHNEYIVAILRKFIGNCMRSPLRTFEPEYVWN